VKLLVERVDEPEAFSCPEQHFHDQPYSYVVGHFGSIVTIRASAGDDATDEIVAALHTTGRFQPSTTTIDGRAMIRFAFLSPRTTEGPRC
jgi:hypothetical protein